MRGTRAFGLAVAVIAVAAATLVLLGALGTSPTRGTVSSGSALVLPNFVERQGNTTGGGTTAASDTILYAVNASGIGSVPTPASPSVHLDVYAFGNGGQPLLSATSTPVCNPCAFNVGKGRKITINVENLIQNAGGFPQPVVSGFMVVVVTGAGKPNTAIDAFEVYRDSTGQITRTALPLSDVDAGP
jgi:hypothetical protein